MQLTLSKALKGIARAPEVIRCMRETPQWRKITSCYLGSDSARYPFTVTLHTGERVEMREPTDVGTLWQIFFHRAYRVKPSDRFILDAGANIGLFMLYAARSAPASKIYCIEPFPSTFDRLGEVVRDNNLSDRAACFNIALTGNTGNFVMRCTSRPSQRRQVFSTDATGVSSVAISGITLGNWMEHEQIAELDLMKMDIEGSEYEVLLSTPAAILKRIRRIVLEYHNNSPQYNKNHLREHLQTANFRITSDVCNAEGYGVFEAVLAQ